MLIGHSVTLDVAAELRGPVVGIRARRVAVLGAGVPVAAIDEDGDATGREGDVRPHAHLGEVDDWILAEAVAAAMEE